MVERRVGRRDLIIGAAAGAVALGLPRFTRAAGLFHLRLMETTDLHISIYPYDYYRDRPDDTVGLAKTATLIDQARAEAPNSLMFDNGDLIQGNPLGDFMAYQHGMKDGDVHPVIKALNTIGYDCATVGNHEFNYGLDFLMKCLAGAKHPIVSANIYTGPAADTPTRDKTLLKPYVILERELVDGAGNKAPIRIGVIGFVPPQIVDWDSANLAGKVATRDIVSTAAAFVPEIRASGADLVVALSHSGISTAAPVDGEENASFHLSRVPGIDVIFTGHAHQVFPGPNFDKLDGIDLAQGRMNGVPAMMAGFWGSHLGVVDLTLANEGNRWQVTAAAVQPRGIYRRDNGKVVPLVEPKPLLLQVLQPEHQATLAYVRQPVGKTTKPVNSYFSLVNDDPSVQIVAQAQTWYVAPLMKTPQYAAYAGLPLLSAAAPFKAGGRNGADYYTDVPAGDIALKNVADLYLYPNLVRAVAVTGAQVREWLERSAGIFRQIQPSAAEQPLIDDGFPSYNFDVIAGVTYRIDLTQPSRYDLDGKLAAPDAHRIVDLSYQGKPIDPTAKFVVATNNYRAGGGGNFAGADGSTTILAAPDLNRDVLVRYLHEKGTIDPLAEPVWSFKPVPGASNVVFQSAPAAQRYLEQVRHATYVGAADGGFAKYRIDLSAV